MKTLYIHIGTPKTGTTAIQTFCVENVEPLKRMGYAYPPCPYNYPNVSSKRNNARFLVGTIKDEAGIRNMDEENRIFKEGMLAVRELFQNFNCVILSDEAIWRTMDSSRKNLWEELKQEAEAGKFQIKVIVYLRRQDKFISSLWNQKTKKMTGSLGEEKFEEFLERIDKDLRLDYYAKLERISKVLGKENVIVRRFEPKSFYGGNIYSDFMQGIGISNMDGFVFLEGERNSGLSGNTHEIKRILNGLPEMKDMKKQEFFIQVLRHCAEISGKKYPSELFSKEEAQALLADYEEGNQKIVREYLNEEGTELFDLSMKDVPKWDPENPYMMEDVIRFVGESTLCLLEEQRQIRDELREEQERMKYAIKHPVRTTIRKIITKMRRTQH